MPKDIPAIAPWVGDIQAKINHAPAPIEQIKLNSPIIAPVTANQKSLRSPEERYFAYSSPEANIITAPINK
jgi:hypothetical protein